MAPLILGLFHHTFMVTFVSKCLQGYFIQPSLSFFGMWAVLPGCEYVFPQCIASLVPTVGLFGER